MPYYLIKDELYHSSIQSQKYGVPEQKKFPLFDLDHVKSAIKFFNYVDPKYENQLAKAILRRAKEYGLDLSEMSIGDNNRFKKYLPNDELKHHGILGQKWGVRRYQNPDGTYTAEGRVRRSKLNTILDKTKTSKRIREAFKDPYTITAGDASRIEKNKRDYRNADLGLKTLDRLGMNFGADQPYGEDPEYDKMSRRWFLIEDQTIGLGAICDLVNRGFSSQEISKIIDTASVIENKIKEKELDISVNSKLDSFIWELSEAADYGKEFAEAAEKTYKIDKLIADKNRVLSDIEQHSGIDPELDDIMQMELDEINSKIKKIK